MLWSKHTVYMGKVTLCLFFLYYQFFSPLNSADSSKHNEIFLWQVNSEKRCQSGMTRDFTEQIVVLGVSTGTVGKRRKHHFNPTYLSLRYIIILPCMPGS